MVWPAVIAAGASIAGGLLGNSASRSEARKNRKWQEYMSNTAYQRAMKDMELAGLNPMLAYMQGGASTPSGATAQQQNPASGVGEILSNSALKASQKDAAEASIDVMQTQSAKNTADADLAMAQTDATRSQTTGTDLSNQERIYLRDKFDSFGTAGKELDAKAALAVYNRFAHSRDYNTLQYLDEFANKNGFRNFDTAVRSAEFRRLLTSNALLSNDMPRSQAEAEFYRGNFGKYVAPYLNSAKSIGSAAVSGATAGAIMRR